MVVVARPLAQAISTSAIVSLGCLGLDVGIDFVLLAVVALGAGALNFGFAIIDARKANRRDGQIEKQGEQIDGLVSAFKTLGLREPTVPLHLLDLTKAPSWRLKELIADLTARMRIDLAEMDANQRERSNRRMFESVGERDLPEPERSRLWWQKGGEDSAAWDQEKNRFNNAYIGSAVALWDELVRRVGTPKNPSGTNATPSAIAFNGTNNSYGMEELVVSLEAQARRLPDD